MKKYLNCYKPTQKGLPGNKILISGRCHTVKAIYLSEQLKKACSNGYMTVVIDYGRTNSFSGILYCNGFQNQYIFVTEEDNYKPISKAEQYE